MLPNYSLPYAGFSPSALSPWLPYMVMPPLTLQQYSRPHPYTRPLSYTPPPRYHTPSSQSGALGRESVEVNSGSIAESSTLPGTFTPTLVSSFLVTFPGQTLPYCVTNIVSTPSGFSSPPTEVQAPTVQPSQSAGPIPTPQSSGSIGTPPASCPGTEALSTSPSVSSVSGSTDGSGDVKVKTVDPTDSKEKRYTGEIHRQSKCVGRLALVYRIPGTSDAYTFIPEEDCESPVLYRCRGCDWLNGKRRKHVTIKAQFTDTFLIVEFLTDPCSLPHACSPESYQKAVMRTYPYEPKPVRKRVVRRTKKEKLRQVEPKELGDLDLD